MDDILTARVFIGSDGLGWTWKIEDDQFCFVRFGDDDLVQFHGGMHSANVGRFPTWHKLTSSLRWTSQFSHFYYYSAPAHFIFCPNKKVLNFHFQVFALLLITKILFPMTTQKRNCSSVQTSFQFFHGELSFIHTFNHHKQRNINWLVTELSNNN